MIGLPEERAVILGEYIRDTGSTLRKAAKIFGLSKSTVHKDVSHRLRVIKPSLYTEVKAVLDKNKDERHIRGGNATKLKYCSRNVN
ncbi:MAG: sporulation transcriptional regulator SpoIIID [Clostridia bacterium]|nr:sporulation transcriptional regulator SpoIIID [Clostridia bacterium]MBR5265660.1 sporulation transcriptional regulator SpoIIID [Clostridia bacterium]